MTSEAHRKAERERLARYKAKYPERVSANAIAQSKRQRHLHKQLLLVFLATGCEDCGTLERLHFHHRDKTTKLYSVSQMDGMRIERVLSEIAKCDVLCVACHARRHADDENQRHKPRRVSA